jgi:putative hydrolase of the HAD superfamily
MYKFIIFDLDDTLYARENGLMEEVGRRIQTWLCENMALTWEDAVALRRKYYHQYEAMLAAIPLRRVVYTNATAEYARRVLGVLGVTEHFEVVVGIEDVGLLNKPHQEAYERVLVRLDAWGPECIMVEDSARNLNPAKALGMTTVLVDALPDWSVDFVVKDVLQVGQVVKELLDAD